MRKPSSSQSSVSTSDAPAGKFKDEKNIFQRLFGRPMEKTRVITLDKNTGEPKKKHKKPCWWRKNSSRAAPAPEEPNQKKQCPSTPHQDIVVNVKGGKGKLPDRVLQVLPKTEVNCVFTVPKTHTHQRIKCLGFPNPSQMCYMNSCLQSLLTLEDFVQAIKCQEAAWSSNPDAAIMRLFMDISKCHFSDDLRHKCLLLSKFKHAVATWNPEFSDFHQKDAHEFLTSVFNQMRSLGTQLKASSPTYSCPVEDCMLFKMQNVRTCRGCGAGSCTEEEYTHLSLDITPGGDTVEQMLENYLKQTELEYSCHCGAKTSGTRMQFVNLPRVLILHIKRFRFTPAFQLKKVHDPINILRDLVVSSNEGDACFSLVSTISHISPAAINGHYISDGVDLDVGQEDPNDRWFSYNDTVKNHNETTLMIVCSSLYNHVQASLTVV